VQLFYYQVAPVLLTPSVLERMRNNFIVVEVWDKKTTSEKDQIIIIILYLSIVHILAFSAGRHCEIASSPILYVIS
jgi:hypothetical protein